MREDERHLCVYESINAEKKKKIKIAVILFTCNVGQYFYFQVQCMK